METSLNDITFILGRLEGKMDSILAAHSLLEARTVVAESRISSLENYRAYLLGACIAVPAVVSWFLTKL